MKRIETDKTYILFHYSFSNLAGTERVLSNLIEMISSTGAHLVLLLASKKEKMAIDLTGYPVEIHYLSYNNANSGNQVQLIRAHYHLYQRFRNFLKEQEFDQELVIISTNVFLSTVAYLGCRQMKLQKTRFIACEHFSLHVAGKFSKLIRKKFYRYMTVITLTQRDREEIANHYSPAACICIPNASPFEIDAGQYDPGYKTILAIGRFSHQKGFDLLIEAYAKIAGKYPDWKLVIAGDDFGTRPLVEQMITEYGIKNIALQPATKHIEELYRSASFFVLSSRFEGLPMVLIEAISFGLPVVSFDCPTGPREIVDSDNGILVEDGNIVSLAISMQQLIDSKDMLQEKSKGAVKTAQAFDKKKINRLWQDIL